MNPVVQVYLQKAVNTKKPIGWTSTVVKGVGNVVSAVSNLFYSAKKPELPKEISKICARAYYKILSEELKASQPSCENMGEILKKIYP